MVFASGVFLYWFLPLVLLGTISLPRALRNPFLTAASFVFYSWWRPDYSLLMLATAAFDFSTGKLIDRARQRGARGTGWLVLSLCANLGLLAWFKYANFGVASWNSLMTLSGGDPVRWSSILLPVGISFYTFQSMSYTIDVWRGHLRATRHFGDFLCFVSLFPQLVAGPIVRYRDVATQMSTHRCTLPMFAQGSMFVMMGLAKKVLIADVLAPVVSAAFDHGAPGSADAAWCGLVAYTLQIYYDFSGYSDMAIGLGLMIGLRFPFNFAAPYKADSITEFWRRWHITLSTWLRDYLYIAMGGNRGGRWRTHMNLMLTMLLGGLWHGANWTFVAWGGLHGALLSMERVPVLARWRAALPRMLRVALTLAAVMAAWVFFRADSIETAGAYFVALGDVAGSGGIDALSLLQVLLLVGGAALALFGRTTQDLVQHSSWTTLVWVTLLFFMSLIHLHWQDHVPFLYYQF
ncbi:MAG: MBOAT family protein [Planctomycetes bacterium]|nr:MBOAT family protein [Planctomycetota bacterium]